MIKADNSLHGLAVELGQSLWQTQSRAATVESCTGGGVARMITEVPGSSQWFERGFVTYTNEAKTEMAGVPGELIDRHGAVSEQVAIAMAEGGLRFSRADYCVAITGVAGPDGGTEAKPVGTVWFAWAGRQRQTRAALSHFNGDRHTIREQSIAKALTGMLEFVGCSSG